MANRRFSPTTFVLVGISLAALYLVGKTVTPPPAAPPPVAASSPSGADGAMSKPATPAEAKAAVETANARTAKMKQMEMEMSKHTNLPPKKDAFNPSSIETTSDYWHNHAMGDQGVKAMRAKVAKVEEEQKHTPPEPVHKAAPAMPMSAP